MIKNVLETNIIIFNFQTVLKTSGLLISRSTHLSVITSTDARNGGINYSNCQSVWLSKIYTVIEYVFASKSRELKIIMLIFEYRKLRVDTYNGNKQF